MTENLRRSRWRGRLARYGPLVFWIGVIFYFSSSFGSFDQTSRFVRPLLEFMFPSASPELLTTYHGYVQLMSIIDKVKEAALNQFIEVIEWLDESKDTLLYRFPVAGHEIKNEAQLIVRESQAAVFVFEGQVADVFTPGKYTGSGTEKYTLTPIEPCS